MSSRPYKVPAARMYRALSHCLSGNGSIGRVALSAALIDSTQVAFGANGERVEPLSFSRVFPEHWHYGTRDFPENALMQPSSK